MDKNVRYTQEYKTHCVGVLEKSIGTETVANIAARLKVNKNTLYGWYKQYGEDRGRGLKEKKTVSKNHAHLVRENNLLRRECELLRELNAVLQMR